MWSIHIENEIVLPELWCDDIEIKILYIIRLYRIELDKNKSLIIFHYKKNVRFYQNGDHMWDILNSEYSTNSCL